MFTKYSDLFEVVHWNLNLVSLCVFTGAECGKGLLPLIGDSGESDSLRHHKSITFWIEKVTFGQCIFDSGRIGRGAKKLH